jgi:murein DD-endopeptidase MepM/ murein hydrolase activator NlpD
MYSHLSRMMVDEQQAVKKGEIIGRTGMTGLAGGDHLHFAVFIRNTFVDPLEWWDAAWIENNIMAKIKEVKSEWQ